MGTISKKLAKNGVVSYRAKCRRKGFKTQSKTFHELKDAKAYIRAVERAFDLGEIPERGAAPANGLNALVDVLRRYRETVCPEHRGGWIEVLTINCWLRQEFVHTPLDKLTTSVMAARRDQRLKEVKPGTVGREMNLLYGAINKARAEWGCTQIPDCKVARPKAPPHRDRVLSEEEEAICLLAHGPIRTPI